MVTISPGTTYWADSFSSISRPASWLNRISSGSAWPQDAVTSADQGPAFRVRIPRDLDRASSRLFINNIQKLAEFRRLPVGWDGRRGRGLTDQALRVAVTILLETATSVGVDPQIFPLPSGGVQIEWHAAGNSIEIEIDQKGDSHLFADTADGEEVLDREVSPVFLDGAMVDVLRSLKRINRIYSDWQQGRA